MLCMATPESKRENLACVHPTAGEQHLEEEGGEKNELGVQMKQRVRHRWGKNPGLKL